MVKTSEEITKQIKWAVPLKTVFEKCGIPFKEDGIYTVTLDVTGTVRWLEISISEHNVTKSS